MKSIAGTVVIVYLLLLPTITFAVGDDDVISFDPKSINAVRTSTPPVVDGYLDDDVWTIAPVAGNFVQYSPFSGRPASFSTEVRVLYDDEALYIAAMMYDPNPDSIYVDLGQRDSDNNLNADMFYIEISTFNDGINGETFKISASGVQSDSKATTNVGRGSWGRGDSSWDAVWESKVRVTGEGWSAELRIPYSALRFSQSEEQTWGINFWREIRRYREQSSWSYVDREIGTSFNHLGELTGLRNLIPPVRLSLTPYLSGYIEKYDGDRAGLSYSGGMDIKYGISESFTLDATLIPDFGQVQSDDQVLNLSPYEVKYNERRPFFMEGTELFSRGDIFYSRRVGSAPRMNLQAYEDMSADEHMVSNPQETSLINASKLSGRTDGGLGIGIFNAITRPSFAEIENTESGEVRHIKTEPLTNYNMLVLDQSLRNNSYISVVNTNVWRRADRDELYYTANVTGTDFRLQTNNRLYSVSGKAALSQKYYDEESTRLGHSVNMSLGKTGGRLRAEYQLAGVSDTYDPNDMGYLRRNNEFRNSLNISYNTHQPFWIVYTTNTSLSYSYNQLYAPRVFTGSSVNFSSMTILNNYWMVTLRGEYKPKGEDDYYITRIPGRYYHTAPEMTVNLWFDTDRSKRYYFDFKSSLMRRNSDETKQREYSISVSQEYKFSKRFTSGLDLNYANYKNDIGYVSYDSVNNDIIFGKRDNTTFTTTIESEYIFTADSYLTFRLRHYWSRADYDGEYYVITDNGRAVPGTYAGNPDYNYNAFNIDMVYTWRFAPGSEMTMVWKNAIYSGSDIIMYDYFDNIRDMLASPALNSLSLKILYYLDYQSIRKRG